jgi:hypothetical protein
LLTNNEIEANGGNYLIIADLLSKREELQVIGRIGRLGARGKWHYVLYEHGCVDNPDVYISTF